MSWEPYKMNAEENRTQLWRKIKKLEKKLAEKDGTKDEIIIELEQEISELKKENHNLKISNSMLKKKRKTS